MGYRIQGAGCRWSARRVSDAASVRGIVRKHDCAIPTLHPKHSNARGALIDTRFKRLSMAGPQLGDFSASCPCTRLQCFLFMHQVAPFMVSTVLLLPRTRVRVRGRP